MAEKSADFPAVGAPKPEHGSGAGTLRTKDFPSWCSGPACGSHENLCGDFPGAPLTIGTDFSVR
jgi:hypothetical protein